MPTDNSNDRAAFDRRWPMWLASATVIWGALIALGAYWRYRDFKKAGVIFVFALIFAAIWALVSGRGNGPRSN